MCFLGLIEGGLSHSELSAVVLGIFVLIIVIGWQFVRYIANHPVAPDPWDEKVAGELERADCLPICHRCLTPHDESIHFCPQCGAMVGAHTSLMPPLYYYTIGIVFRSGTEGTYRYSTFLIFGYIFAGFLYLFWTPVIGVFVMIIFWYKVFTNLPSIRSPDDEPNSQPPMIPQR